MNTSRQNSKAQNLAKVQRDAARRDRAWRLREEAKAGRKPSREERLDLLRALWRRDHCAVRFSTSRVRCGPTCPDPSHSAPTAASTSLTGCVAVVPLSRPGSPRSGGPVRVPRPPP